MIDLNGFIKDEGRSARSMGPMVSLRIGGKLYFNRKLQALMNMNTEDKKYAQFFLSPDKKKLALKILGRPQDGCRKIWGSKTFVCCIIKPFLDENGIVIEENYRPKTIETDPINRTIAFELP